MRRFCGVVVGSLLLTVSGCDQPAQQAKPDTPSEEATPTVTSSTTATAEPEAEATPEAERSYRGLLGPDNPKVVTQGDSTRVWAGGKPPGDAEADYFDFTGAPLDPEKLQFGIGKDRIKAIDDPYFVAPDDPRLMQMRVSRYRPEERPQTIDDIMVIGYAVGDDVRAYPTALLDGHELVNDTIGGKPVTVGW